MLWVHNQLNDIFEARVFNDKVTIFTLLYKKQVASSLLTNYSEIKLVLYHLILYVIYLFYR